MNSFSYRPVLWGGLIAGLLDITAAFVNGAVVGARSPMWVLQSIASGLVGANSYTGGVQTAALGAALHFLIAFVAATVYYLASRQFEFLTRQAIVSGLLYGVAVYLFMYLVVLPLTFHRSFIHPLRAVITAVLIHMFCVGLPIGLVVRHYKKVM